MMLAKMEHVRKNSNFEMCHKIGGLFFNDKNSLNM